MLSFFRQLAERTDNSNSSTLRSRLRLNGRSSCGSSARICCGSSEFMKNSKWAGGGGARPLQRVALAQQVAVERQVVVRLFGTDLLRLVEVDEQLQLVLQD